MARIDLQWTEPKLNTYEGFDPDHLYPSLPESFRTAAKPGIVFLTSDLADEAQLMKNVEGTCFRDENFQIGATMFQQIKMNGNKVKENHPFARLLGGKQLPRIVVIDHTGAKVGSVEGQDVSPSKVFGLMNKAASKTYKTPLETIVKETKTILTEIDQIEAKRAALATKKASSTKQKDAEWAKEEEALNEQMKAVETREAALKKKWSEERKVAKA